MQVHFVTLGCPKNRVDSELMLGQLAETTGELVLSMDPETADVIVVNTCGFIEDAKKESIDVIMEMARHRAEDPNKRLIVTGCLAQRYPKELRDEIPEIDALLGAGAYAEMAEVIRSANPQSSVQTELSFIHQATSPRLNTFMPHTAYVKISEGCDQKCSFCIIPKLRGTQRSRPIADIVLEAETLASRGVVEINLIAQDLTGYGHDLEPKVDLSQLLTVLGQVQSLRWIRLHYAYPRPFSKALLHALRETPKLVPYLDMPLQHIADPILKRMKRGRPRAFVEKLIGQLFEAVPDLSLRSSFIVGFPGETEAHFHELCQFIQDTPFERVGVFKYSHEEGTTAYELDSLVAPEVIDERHHALMLLLAEKSRQRLGQYLGKRIEVIVDGLAEDTDLLLAGRHKGQAPEVDGTTYINDGAAKMGDIVEVEITETFDYDLVGHITKMLHPAPQRPEHARMHAPRTPKLQVISQ